MSYEEVCATVAMRLAQHDQRAEDQWIRRKNIQLKKFGPITASFNVSGEPDDGTDDDSDAQEQSHESLVTDLR